MTDTISRQELRFDGADNDELSVTLWESAAGDLEATFVIVNRDSPEWPDQISIPLEKLMPLVLALGGSITRYIEEAQS